MSVAGWMYAEVYYYKYILFLFFCVIGLYKLALLIGIECSHETQISTISIIKTRKEEREKPESQKKTHGKKDLFVRPIYPISTSPLPISSLAKSLLRSVHGRTYHSCARVPKTTHPSKNPVGN
jgi:hypothetical protein